MQNRQLKNLFEQSSAIRLIRSTNAPFVIDFLKCQFKQAGTITRRHSELVASLREYQTQLHRQQKKGLADSAENYLNAWCTEDTRWLHRFLEADQPEPVYELTPDSESALAFVDRIVQQDLGFVGTDSRLKLVIDTLADLTVGASADPQARLDHLRNERQRLDAEIARIESTGNVDSYHPAQIRERFSTAVDMLKQLQGDFRSVEDRFRRITREVQQQQHQQSNRGRILQYALDAEDLIRQDDQGVSFYEFVRFILSPVQQDKLQTVISQLNQIDSLAEHTEGMSTIHSMIPLLLAEAEKVMRTSQRLSTTLRRILDIRAHNERQRVATTLGEIRSLAASLASQPPSDIGIDVVTSPDIQCAFAKGFWVEPAEFEQVDLTEHAVDASSRTAAFESLARMQRLDWQRLRTRVADSVAMYETPTLGRILNDHPPESGIVEIMGYIQIAHDDGHYISIEAQEQIVIPRQTGEGSLAVTVPLVRFMVSP